MDEPTIKQILSGHFKFNVSMYVIIGLVLLMMGYFMYSANTKFERQMAVAQEREEKFLEMFNQFKEDRKANQERFDQLEALIASKQNTVVIREKETAKQVAEVTTPKDTKEVMEDASKILTTNIQLESNQRLSFLPLDVQKFSATKLEHDSLWKDKIDLQDIVAKQNTQKELLTKDLNVCSTTLDSCRKSIEDYKKVAVKSRWRKIGEGAGKVLIFVSGVALGHAL